MTALAILPALAVLFCGQPAEPHYPPQVAEVQFAMPGTVAPFIYPQRKPEEPAGDGLVWARRVGADSWLLLSAEPGAVSLQVAIPTGGDGRE